MNLEKPANLRTRANQLHRQGDLIGALRVLDHMIEIEVARADDWCLTGELLSDVGELAQAIGAFEQCLQQNAAHVAARYGLGRALYKLGDADRAAQLIERVAEETDHPEIWMGLATIAPGVPSYDHPRVRQIRERFAQLTREAEPLLANLAPRPDQPRSPLKIGYLSAHFHDAKYMKPVWPLINAHDSNHFEIHLFDDAADHTPAWHWLHRAETQVHQIQHLSNSQLATKIRTLEVDILVDLSAYSHPQRLGVYLLRAAPVQMAWFNMYATSGIREMDFIIGDRFVLHHNERRFYTEQSKLLPVSYLTFQTNHLAPPVGESPCAANGYLTFGCLGTLYKITPPVIESWSQILLNSPSAKLLLSNADLKSICNQQFVLERFQQQGVPADQICFLPPADHFEFLQYYDLIDVALDTFPYNGGTTTMEALWQGVPVLTFSGDRWASRTSHSIVGHSHLGQFVAPNRKAFVDLAVAYANDQKKQDALKTIRSTMRAKLQASSICNVERLAQAMESIYRSAIRRSSA